MTQTHEIPRAWARPLADRLLCVRRDLKDESAMILTSRGEKPDRMTAIRMLVVAAGPDVQELKRGDYLWIGDRRTVWITNYREQDGEKFYMFHEADVDVKEIPDE